MANSKFGPCTIASTGQDCSHNPHYIHLSISISYLVVLRLPYDLSCDSIVIACAGQTASHNLHAIHLSSPFGYLLKACSPLARGLTEPFSNG